MKTTGEKHILDENDNSIAVPCVTFHNPDDKIVYDKCLLGH